MPTAADRAPGLRKQSFDCPNCGAFAHQTWFALGRDDEDAYTDDGEFSPVSRDGIYDTPAERELNPPPTGGNGMDVINFMTTRLYNADWAQAQCTACGMFSTWRGSRLVYPVANTLPLPHGDMPKDVVPLYMEAREVAVVSPRAGAALARATMEKLLRALLENTKDDLIILIDQVEPLVNRSLADLLMYVRHVGNSALHVKSEPDAALVLVLDEETTEALTALFVVINQLVDELITRPAQNAALIGAVPESVKTKVAQLRAKREQNGS